MKKTTFTQAIFLFICLATQYNSIRAMKRQISEISNDQHRTQFIEFPCDECDRNFTQQGNLKRHIKRIHTKEKFFACDICPKSFTQKDYLQKHITRVHTKEKLYTCNICPKSFFDGGNLRRHRIIHTGQIPYSCATCLKQFIDKSNYVRHIQSHVPLELRIKKSIIKEFDTRLSTQEFIYMPLEDLPFKEAIQKLEWTH